MVSRRRFTLFVLSAIVLGGLACFCLSSLEREPIYLDGGLTEWVTFFEYYRNRGASRKEIEIAAQPVRKIGTNAIPSLLRWLNDEPAPWRFKLRRILYKFPEPLRNSAALEGFILNRNKMTHDRLALPGFEALGSMGGPAIPQLAQYMNDTSRPSRAKNAIFALSFIGNDALPDLLKAATNRSYPWRSTVLFAITYMGSLGTNAPAAIPALLQCLDDPDAEISTHSLRALSKLKLLPEIVVPLLTKELDSANKDVVTTAILDLENFGPDAAAAVPALLRCGRDTSYEVRILSEGAVFKIDPKTH